MRTLLPILTDQSTIISILFCRRVRPNAAGTYRRAARAQRRSSPCTWIRTQSRLVRNVIRFAFIWVDRQSRVLREKRHVRSRILHLRNGWAAFDSCWRLFAAVIRRNIHNGFNLSADDARVLWSERRKAECERFNFRIRSTSRIACGLNCAPWSELTINSDCAPGRCELQYGTTPSELLGVSPRPRSPMIEWYGIPRVIGSLFTAFTNRSLGSSVSTLFGIRFSDLAAGSATRSGLVDA